MENPEVLQPAMDGSLWEVLARHATADPFSLAASLIFLFAIIHTFLTPTFRNLAHYFEVRHRKKESRNLDQLKELYFGDVKEEVSFMAEILHFFGEVEAVFGIWIVVLGVVFAYFKGWHEAVHYVGEEVNFTEPMFVVVIMTLSASRPILRFAESLLSIVARIGGGSIAAWWFTILSIGPLLGSFITEPAAMTISALLLAKQFYEYKPPARFAYGTIGLLFVNVSIGGTLSHFAAPPVLMVAGKWNWDMMHMITFYGWKSALAILIANIAYYLIFRGDFKKMQKKEEVPEDACPVHWEDRTEKIPVIITLVHIFFIGWTVLNAHHPVLFIGGFLFFIGFHQATVHHQNRLDLKPPLLVGFFLAGLVTHGGLQKWWITPVLGSMNELQLLIGATVLTAFNDNAAITYLSSLVPTFTASMKYAVVAGAVAGGGLTVIANAPNPAGQSILQKFFENGVSPLKLAAAALFPTILVVAIFYFMPPVM